MNNLTASVQIKRHQPPTWKGLSPDQFTESTFVCYCYVSARMIGFTLQAFTQATCVQFKRNEPAMTENCILIPPMGEMKRLHLLIT